MQRFTLNTIERQIIKAHQLNQFNQSLQRYSSITVQPLKQKISSSKWSANPELLLSSNQVVLKAHYSQQGRPGFFASVVSNIKENFSKNKEMQESLKKFREEARQLEESDALKEARRKFESIEKETGKSSNVLKEQLGGIAGNLVLLLTNKIFKKKSWKHDGFALLDCYPLRFDEKNYNNSKIIKIS